MGWWEAIPAIASAAGSMIGSQKQGQYSDEALGLQRDAYGRALDLINSGDLSYTPQQAQGLTSGALGNARPDAYSQLAEQDALGELQKASKEGYNSIDRAAINAMLAETNQQERGNREAIQERFAPGSGAGIAARLSNQQAGAQRANQTGLGIAAGSRAKALEALGAYGGMASKMRSQSFNEDAKRGEARDAIDRFNAETSRFNAGQANAASQAGINNRLAGAGVLNGATNGLATGLLNRGQQAFNQASGAGYMAGQAGAAIGAGSKKKEDEEE